MFGPDILALAEQVLAGCRARGWRVATAESCTGGLVAAALTAIPGSSDVFERGFVTYSNAAKTALLGVPEATLATHGAVSAETAEAMAEGPLSRAPVDLAVSVTGFAGPGGGSVEKPIGLVFLGVARRGGAGRAERHVFSGDRAAVRDAAVRRALELLLGEADAGRADTLPHPPATLMIRPSVATPRSPAMPVKNAWYIGAWADELGAAPLARRICDEPVVLFRDAAGKAAALADRCCHRAAPLSMGKIVEAGIECGYHGLTFDSSGRCVRIPGQRQIPEDACVRSYPVVEKDRLVWLWLGEADRADPKTIVDFPFHDDAARWPNKHDVYPTKGNYMLMVDNLMDLTHLGYLHAKTVGGNPSAHVEAEMKTVRTPAGLKFTRWMKNSVPPPSYVRAAGFKGRVDRCQEFEFVAPSTILQWTGAIDAGTPFTDPQRDFQFQFRLFHGLTPETETTCFYFWSVANGYRQNEPEATEQLYQEIAPTFVEDRVMVEAQQARLSEFGEAGLVDIASDANRMHMRRMIERLAAERPPLAAE